jgi:hypothetical protein
MIFYDWEKECWVSDINSSFKVDMTPEVREDCEKTFDTESGFWDWYNGNQ